MHTVGCYQDDTDLDLDLDRLRLKERLKDLDLLLAGEGVLDTNLTGLLDEERLARDEERDLDLDLDRDLVFVKGEGVLDTGVVHLLCSCSFRIRQFLHQD